MKKVLQCDILERGMKSMDDCPITMAQIRDIYARGRKSHRFSEPTKEDYKIAETFAKIGARGACMKFKLDSNKVNAAVWRVGREMVLKANK